MLAQTAIIRYVPTFNIRDIPDEIASAIDAAASAANARSREAFLRDFLSRSFGPDESVVAAIAARARMAVTHFETLGRFLVLHPAPTVSIIARALGHADPALFEAELRGDRPLSFTDGDRLCDLLSLQREWLDSGGDAAPHFSTSVQYHDCHQLLRYFLQNGIKYEELYFVLSEQANGDAAIIGHTPSEDPAVGWRYDVLMDNIPIHDQVGGTGRAQRRDFADLMVALYTIDTFGSTPSCYGRIVPATAFEAMVSGYVHPATATNTYAPGAAQAMARRSHWHEDFWLFDRSDSYTRGYSQGRAALLKELQADGISTTEQYKVHVAKMIRAWKLKRRAE